MAEYILDVVSQTSKLDWVFPFQRTAAFPLDRSALFSSLADAQKYAAGDGSDERELGGTSYVGQIISVYEAAGEEGGSGSANAYIITPDRSLLKLAATTTTGDFAADIAALEGKLAALEIAYNSRFEAVEGDIVDLKEAVGNVYTKSEIDGKVEGLNGSISDEVDRATQAEEALDDKIGELDTAISGEADRAKKAEQDLADDIAELVLGLAGKADADNVYAKTETYTKSEVETYVQSQIGSAGHLKREIVLALPVDDIDVDTIYMIAKESAEEKDVYVEYMYIEGAWEIIGDTTVDLSDYAKSADVQTKIDEVVESIGEVSAAVATKAEQADLEAFEGEVAASFEGVNSALDGKAAKADLEALQGEVAAIKDAESGILVQAKAYTDEEIAKVNAVVETKVDNSTYSTAIENINTNISNINQIIGEAGGDSSVAERLSALESNKADKATTLAGYGITDAYTKGETYTRAEIADLIADITGGESAADVLAALNTYIGTNDQAVAALQEADVDFETRVSALEAVGAQANVLEAINFNGQDIAIVDKKATFSYEYSLPVAVPDALGGVKSSDLENKVSVDADGYMEVNSLNVNKLVQTSGDILVLNGGSANI